MSAVSAEASTDLCAPRPGKPKRLGELASTAICGNDITSSCLYVSALAILYAALLGISGFESSANFVEEQEPGVFPKTLRNTWLATLISVDAALVLSGAVLTSFVGVNGLVARMTLDRCLPQFLLKKNGRGTTHRILIAFFVLAVSVLLTTRGDLKALAGVYTISFLAVMALFGGGNILLKVKRAKLPREVKASWPTVLVAIGAVVLGLLGNAKMNPAYLKVFFEYFVPAALIVIVMLERIRLLKAIMVGLAKFNAFFGRSPSTLTWTVREKIQ